MIRRTGRPLRPRHRNLTAGEFPNAEKFSPALWLISRISNPSRCVARRSVRHLSATKDNHFGKEKDVLEFVFLSSAHGIHTLSMTIFLIPFRPASNKNIYVCKSAAHVIRVPNHHEQTHCPPSRMTGPKSRSMHGCEPCLAILNCRPSLSVCSGWTTRRSCSGWSRSR